MGTDRREQIEGKSNARGRTLKHRQEARIETGVTWSRCPHSKRCTNNERPDVYRPATYEQSDDVRPVRRNWIRDFRLEYLMYPRVRLYTCHPIFSLAPSLLTVSRYSHNPALSQPRQPKCCSLPHSHTCAELFRRVRGARRAAPRSAQRRLLRSLCRRPRGCGRLHPPFICPLRRSRSSFSSPTCSRRERVCTT